ncbi:MAG: hypothetical protein OXC69_08655 [Candidatus Tectomicrobia bacterium]|nr:hypothetical protein [Candidatus Tectomicrobia bacterium]
MQPEAKVTFLVGGVIFVVVHSLGTAIAKTLHAVLSTTPELHWSLPQCE